MIVRKIMFRLSFLKKCLKGDKNVPKLLPKYSQSLWETLVKEPKGRHKRQRGNQKWKKKRKMLKAHIVLK